MSKYQKNLELQRKAQAYFKGQSDDQHAAALFIEQNCGLIGMVAGWYFQPTSGMDRDDVIEAGKMGVMHALTLYDESRGVAFSTYVTPWIRQYVSRALYDEAFTIRLPREIQGKIGRVKELRRQFYATYGCYPTAQEISDAWDGKHTAAEIETWLAYPVVDYTLDRPVGEGDDTSLHFLAAEDDTWIRDGMIVIKECLPRLKPLEEYVLRRQFNLHPDFETPGTPHEIAAELKVTRSYVSRLVRSGVFHLKCLVTGKEPEPGEAEAVIAGRKRKLKPDLDEYYYHNEVLKNRISVNKGAGHSAIR